MNVMKHAHRLVRQTLKASGCAGLNYKSLFIAALKDLHRLAKEGHNIEKVWA